MCTNVTSALSPLDIRKPRLLFPIPWVFFFQGWSPSFTGRRSGRRLSEDCHGLGEVNSHPLPSRIINSKETASLRLLVATFPWHGQEKVSQDWGYLSLPANSHAHWKPWAAPLHESITSFFVKLIRVGFMQLDYSHFIVRPDIRQCQSPDFDLHPDCAGSSASSVSPNKPQNHLVNIPRVTRWDFDLDGTESLYQVWENGHLNNIESSSP